MSVIRLILFWDAWRLGERDAVRNILPVSVQLPGYHCEKTGFVHALVEPGMEDSGFNGFSHSPVEILPQ